jgi:hypothetical protein
MKIITVLSAPSFRVFMRIAGVVFGLNLAIFPAFAQELYFKTGMNATTYEFRNPSGVKLTNFLPAAGSSYEFGFEFPFVKTEQTYPPLVKQVKNQVSLTLEELNGASGDKLTSYRSETRFIGFANRLSFLGTAGPLELGITGLAGIATLLSGTQTFNTSLVDLRESADFKSGFFRYGLGFSTAYGRLDIARLSLSYEFSKHHRLNKKFEEKLNFLTHSILIGVHIPLN